MGNSFTSPSPQSTTPSHIQRFESFLQENNRRVHKSGKINILSYNIFVRPPFINNNGDDFKDERLEQFLQIAHKYDIICLQEIFTVYSSRRETFIQRAREAGFSYHLASPRPNTVSSQFIDAGLLILSKFPIISSEFCEFPYGAGVDYLVQKGALYAKIMIEDSYLHLYNTHTQANYEENPKYYLKRIEQISKFQAFIQDTLARNDYNSGDLTLLTGDFNVDGRSQRKYTNGDIAPISNLQNLNGLSKMEHFTEYDMLAQCLSNDNQDELHDLLCNNHDNEHPTTFGDFVLGENGKPKALETTLTGAVSQCSSESLDYIFRYIPNLPLKNDKLGIMGLKPRAKQELSIVEESASVEKFFIEGHKFTQLSDHYGVKVTLQYTESSSNSADELEDAETSVSTPYLHPQRLESL